MIVLDASAVVELLLGSPRGAMVRARIQRPDESLHAPHLLDVEVASVLRRYHLSGEISDDEGREALADLAGLDIARYPHDPLLPRVWELRRSVTAYDAVYLALAEVLEAPLLTLDRRLARARGHGARVEAP
ncbi:MAG TPA: type II toxin-antitoxin system VapC family toxin [Methylomirabilota bacterium]